MKKFFWRDRRGQALVEMALVLPILIILFMGVIEFGRIFHSYLIITNASREGARVAIVGRSDADIKDRVRFVASDLDPAQLQIDIDPESTGRTSGILVTVTVNYRMELAFPLFEAFLPNPLAITSGTTMRIE